MSSSRKPDPGPAAEAQIEEIERRRAARREALVGERTAQRARDLAALDELEVEHGVEGLCRIELDRYVAGLPTFVVLRLPRAVEMKRYVSQAKNDPLEAANVIASSCVVYPDADTYARVRETFAGVHVHGGVAVLQASQGRHAEEGKG